MYYPILISGNYWVPSHNTTPSNRKTPRFKLSRLARRIKRTIGKPPNQLQIRTVRPARNKHHLVAPRFQVGNRARVKTFLY